MKVFLSWSGDVSRKLAKFLHVWLPTVIQSVEPYFSDENLTKGGRWLETVTRELETSSFAIVILTPEGLESRWLAFEAGAIAIAKGGSSQIVPLLIGVAPAEVPTPLNMFQCAAPAKEDIRRMLAAINGRLTKHSLKEHILDVAFERAWPELEGALRDAEEHARKTSRRHGGRPDQNPSRTEEGYSKQQLDLYREVASAFSQYVLGWQRLIDIANHERVSGLTPQEEIRKEQYVRERSEARQLLWSRLDQMSLFFDQPAIGTTIEEFRAFDDKYRIARLDDLPAAEEWRRFQRRLLDAMSSEMRLS